MRSKVAEVTLCSVEQRYYFARVQLGKSVFAAEPESVIFAELKRHQSIYPAITRFLRQILLNFVISFCVAVEAAVLTSM